MAGNDCPGEYEAAIMTNTSVRGDSAPTLSPYVNPANVRAGASDGVMDEQVHKNQQKSCTFGDICHCAHDPRPHAQIGGAVDTERKKRGNLHGCQKLTRVTDYVHLI